MCVEAQTCLEASQHIKKRKHEVRVFVFGLAPPKGLMSPDNFEKVSGRIIPALA